MENLKQIFMKLQQASGRKDKENILREQQENETFKKVIYFLLNSYIVTGLSKKKINKNIGVIPNIDYSSLLNLGSHQNKTEGFLNLLRYLEDNNTGRDIDISVCEMYFTNFDKDMQEFIKSILTKSIKLGIDAKTVNKVYGKGFIPTWDVQRAYSIKEKPLKDGTWFSLSQKLNGNRASYYNGKLISRQGNPFNGLEHILNDIKTLELEDMFIDGELIRDNVDNVSDNENFRIGNGISKSDNEDKRMMNLVVFDIFPASEFKSGKSKEIYRKRLEFLNKLRCRIDDLNIANIAVVEHFYSGTDQTMIDI
ncbi:hypothetical protein [Anaerovorax sp. IOR16]|uniref:hypothetical protein n=1 Tax=Anaerovorax sp. IOR16 TaxID=2773458 RepID=UPI0019D14361|nr:hypothetical protein [Anaerovorax sp. IOR16]